MLPSDSDDEAPSGGYYIIEGNVRSPVPGNTSLPAANLIPPPPTLPTSPSKGVAKTIPAIREEMEASDSDEEVPSGGFEVRVSEAAQARARRASTSGVKGKEMPSKRRGSLSARLRGTKEEP
jgi:hypothetical protein